MRQANSNEWSGYQPHSNVLWIHYLSDKLCSMKFRRSAGMRKIKAALTRFHNGPPQPQWEMCSGNQTETEPNEEEEDDGSASGPADTF
ncbi:hypothetical protein NHX12_027710 [Muraenolepis orangiensis]|uniref:Serine/threonine-protein kinase haspin C-terminal domain-containing protein n=1 Tax=Muraenolepis orangiensis TaxID=630683 RepID=A0A9Q0IPH8_9TELE|nr:hypothetical protein NHX12_027710 [Muraenolepis orangiensis]